MVGSQAGSRGRTTGDGGGPTGGREGVGGNPAVGHPGVPDNHQAPPEAYSAPAPLGPSLTTGRRPSAAEEARTLIASSDVGTLATLSDDGSPWASLVGQAPLPDGRPVLIVSQLAEHGRNLLRDPRASLVVSAPPQRSDPLDSGRVTVAGRVERVEGERAAEALEVYAAVHPAASLYSGFGDFDTWVLTVDRVRWVGGYGRMDSATAADYLAATPDPVVAGVGAAVAHLNEDHATSLLAMAQRLAGYADATAARCVGADRYGLDLDTRTPRGRATTRVAFDEPLDAPSGLRAATVALARRAAAAASTGTRQPAGDEHPYIRVT